MSELITKSRNLPLADFYTILQQEFISYFVRSQIYPTEYAGKYKTYCDCKKDKIEKIGNKNQLPSIFNSISIKQRYIEEFFNIYGMPNFQYRDENSIRIMGRYDKIYFFGEGVSIKIRDNGETHTSVVVKNLHNINAVTAFVNGEIHQFDYNCISRIISDSLTDF